MEVRRKQTDNVLMHHGIKLQKWGVRRYQNEDGSLTEAGKARYRKAYSKGVNKLKKKEVKYNKLLLKSDKQQMKADKYKDKSYRAWTNKGAEKNESKSLSNQRKASRAKYKATKTYQSGIKYYKKLESKFSEIPVSTLNKEDLAYAKKYANRVLS